MAPSYQARPSLLSSHLSKGFTHLLAKGFEKVHRGEICVWHWLALLPLHWPRPNIDWNKVRHRLLDDVIHHSPRACKKTPTSISCDSLTSNCFHTSRDSVAARRPPQTTVPSAHLPGRLRLILHRSVSWFNWEGKAANAASTVS